MGAVVVIWIESLISIFTKGWLHSALWAIIYDIYEIYVSSNCVSETMHSHIGCIRLIFPHCVLSCVSSNNLSEGINSHTGYIYSICCKYLLFLWDL